MNMFLAGALAAAQPVGVGSPVLATANPAPTAGVTAGAEATIPACCLLAKLTPILLIVDEQVDSDKVVIGQMFTIHLSSPISLADGSTIPAGTLGKGEVVHAAKSRAMGKPGELLLAARYLEYPGTRIPLRSFRLGRPSQGNDNTDTAAIVGMAVSALAAPFITGGEVRIPAGTEGWAKVAADVSFSNRNPASPLPDLPEGSASTSMINNQGGKK
jgi:hypothetical protein